VKHVSAHYVYSTEIFIRVLKHISKLVRKMGWWYYKPWPGHGPWSNLPPWERPGWVLGGWGRGYCWWLWRGAYPPTAPPPPPTPWLSKEDEIKYLEELKKYIDKRLEELKAGK
jgi:hypothetical protein